MRMVYRVIGRNTMETLFPVRVDPHRQWRQTEYGRVAKCTVCPFTLKEVRARSILVARSLPNVRHVLFGKKIDALPFQNSPKNLDPSYKTGLYLYDCFWKLDPSYKTDTKTDSRSPGSISGGKPPFYS